VNSRTADTRSFGATKTQGTPFEKPTSRRFTALTRKFARSFTCAHFITNPWDQPVRERCTTAWKERRTAEPAGAGYYVHPIVYMADGGGACPTPSRLWGRVTRSARQARPGRQQAAWAPHPAWPGPCSARARQGAGPAQPIRPHSRPGLAPLPVPEPPSGLCPQAEPPAWPLQLNEWQGAWAKVALPHGRLVPFLFFAAKDEVQGGLRYADARPESPWAAKWGER